MAKTVLVLGAGALQVPAIQTARRMGLRVVVLDANPAAPGLRLGDVGRVIDIIDGEACLALAKEERVNGVVHICCEVSMQVLGRINDELGLHGVGLATAIRATNKEKMRRAFEAGGAPSPKSIGAARAGEALRAVRALGFPAIVKPSRNSGSRGVSRLGPGTSREAVLEAFRWAVRESRDHSAVVEQFVEGPEFSVEMLFWNNHCKVLAVTDKVTTGDPHYVETGHSQPTRLNACDRERVVDAALRGVKALGINWSAAHAEVKLTPAGPFLMEIGARLGGDFITTELVPRSTGIDMVAAAISLALGEEPDLTPQHSPRAAAVRYLTPSPGTVTGITGVERARTMPGVRIVEARTQVGAVVPEITSSLSRVGHVIAEGATAEAAITAAERARDAITITTLR